MSDSQKKLVIGANSKGEHSFIEPKLANRHGLIAGATGTGKTVTLQVLTEQFSKMGVPVFLSDVKGDLSGLCKPGKTHPKIDERIEKIGLPDFKFSGLPCVFWDLYGEKGHPIRTTISEVGPILLSRLLDLNATQTSIMEMIFKFADDQGLLLLDTKDLKSLLKHFSEAGQELRDDYGNISKVSVGAILRKLLSLEDAGGEQFFGEPALDIKRLMQKDFSGHGVVNILDAQKLVLDKRLYGTFLLWLLSELFEELPEVGDLDKPKLVFFFDEAHLLFNDAPKVLIEKIEMVVRLIRSKGVGIYFVTQNPTDVPDSVLSQLGNRVQHALRAFTEKDKKAVKATAQNFRVNENFKTEDLITQLGVGESLVSCLDSKGTPMVVESVLNSPPESRMGPITAEERKEIVANSPFSGIYDTMVDRESAYESLKKRYEESAELAEKKLESSEKEKSKKSENKKSAPKSRRQGIGETFLKSIVRSVASGIGREIKRGLFGGRSRF